MSASFSGKSVTSHLSSSEASSISWFLLMTNLIGSKQLNHAESAKDLSLLNSLNPELSNYHLNLAELGKFLQIR